MSVTTMLLLLFAVAWLAVADIAVIHLRRGRGTRRKISLLARVGLLFGSRVSPRRSPMRGTGPPARSAR
jgi:hypothetical protein